jgi:hypothetical protein
LSRTLGQKTFIDSQQQQQSKRRALLPDIESPAVEENSGNRYKRVMGLQ